MSLVHPKRHLPPLPAQAPAHQAHQTPTHRVPPAAKAAASCAPPPHAAAAPKYSVGGFFKRLVGADGHQGSAHNFAEGFTGKRGPHGHMGVLGAAQIWTGHLGDAIGDNINEVTDRLHGDTDAVQADREDARKEYGRTGQGLKDALGGDHGLVATGGQALADKCYAHMYPAAAAELNQDAAAQVQKMKAGVASEAYNDPIGFALTVVPIAGLGRAAAAAKMGRAAEAAEAAASAASKAGNMERAAALGRQAKAFQQTAHALEGGKAGDVLRRAKGQVKEKLSAKGQVIGQRGRAAVTRHQDRIHNLSGVSSPGGLKTSLMIGKPYTARGLAARQGLGIGAKGLHILNEKQLALHHRLVKSTAAGGIVLETGEMNFKDVAKLTEATGHEHAVVRLRDNSRMLIKGNNRAIKHIHTMPVKRLIVHSHPGKTPYTLMPSGQDGDLDYLWSIGQRRSYIVTSETGVPGTDYWLGSFDNQGVWRALNTPPMTFAAGQLDYVKGPQARR